MNNPDEKNDTNPIDRVEEFCENLAASLSSERPEVAHGHLDLTKINLLTALSAHRIATALEDLVSAMGSDAEELVSAVEGMQDNGG